jgi:hypothetical protein
MLQSGLSRWRRQNRRPNFQSDLVGQLMAGNKRSLSGPWAEVLDHHDRRPLLPAKRCAAIGRNCRAIESTDNLAPSKHLSPGGGKLHSVGISWACEVRAGDF